MSSQLVHKVLTKEEREQRILELKLQGDKSKEVAQMLGCSESTVNNFMTKWNKAGHLI